MAMLDGDGRRHLAAITREISRELNPTGSYDVHVYTRRKGDVEAVAKAAMNYHRARWEAMGIEHSYDRVERWVREDWKEWFGDHIQP
jgi:hypothetical protein